MNKKWVVFAIPLLLVYESMASARTVRYGERYCNVSGYYCIRIERGQTWASLWPSERQRDVVQRLNRMNIRLRPGMIIAVPRNVRSMSKFDIAPLPRYVNPRGYKFIWVKQNLLAWGAYDAAGRLIHWGPISGGQNYCSDVRRGCRTITGHYKMYTKRGAGCVSSKYPLGRGGARMPYCMFFYKGYALHGSYHVPGYNASHGCVRLFNQDAKWLNQSFIDLGRTHVIIQRH